MHSQSAISLASAVLDQNVVRLLKTNPVAMEISYQATPDHGAKTAVEEDASSAASVQFGIVRPVSVDDKILNTSAQYIVTAYHREHSRGHSLVGDQTIGVERHIKGKSVPIPAGDSPNGCMKSARLGVPNGNSVTDLETIGVRERNLFLAIISIQRQGRNHACGLAQNRFIFGPEHRHKRSQMERIVHHELPYPDLNYSTAQTRNVIHRRLQRPIVRPNNIRLPNPDCNYGPVFHLGMHGLGQLLFLGRWRELACLDKQGQVNQPEKQDGEEHKEPHAPERSFQAITAQAAGTRRKHLAEAVEERAEP